MQEPYMTAIFSHDSHVTVWTCNGNLVSPIFGKKIRESNNFANEIDIYLVDLTEYF